MLLRPAQLAAGALLAAFLAGATAARAETVDVAIVLAADVSRSIDNVEFQLQRKGYASAIISPQVLQAIHAGVHGAIALCFVEWAGDDEQNIVAKWTVINDDETAATFAATLLHAPRSFSGRTAIGAGIDFAMAQLAASGITAERRIIDVSGDGTNNSGRPVTEARDDAVAKGVTVNGLAIVNERTGAPGTFFYGHTHPPGGLPAYYRDNVIGGAGAFMMHMTDFDTFDQAMTNKLVTEISSLETGAAPELR